MTDEGARAGSESAATLGEAAPARTARLLEVKSLTKSFESGGVLFSRHRRTVVDRVSFQLARGESAALVGASGSGKSTIARLLLRLIEPDSGEIFLEGVDVLAREPGGASHAYRRRVQMVFQDPFASLNPVHDVLAHLALPLSIHRPDGAAGLRARAIALLETVGLSPAAELLARHPHQLSGGQRQRVSIARALAAEPELLIADEPTSMLDVSLRVGVLQLLQKLQRERGLAILLITHDLSAARFLANRILVLHQGRIVEEGDAEELIANPRDAYTRALLDALPDPRRPLSQARKTL